jgi:hypothetical protein
VRDQREPHRQHYDVAAGFPGRAARAHRRSMSARRWFRLNVDLRSGWPSAPQYSEEDLARIEASTTRKQEGDRSRAEFSAFRERFTMARGREANEPLRRAAHPKRHREAPSLRCGSRCANGNACTIASGRSRESRGRGSLLRGVHDRDRYGRRLGLSGRRDGSLLASDGRRQSIWRRVFASTRYRWRSSPGQTSKEPPTTRIEGFNMLVVITGGGSNQKESNAA